MLASRGMIQLQAHHHHHHPALNHPSHHHRLQLPESRQRWLPPHLDPHPNDCDISREHHPNTVPKIAGCSGSHLRGDNNEYNEWLHVDNLLERVAVDLRVMSARDVELDRVRVLVAAIDSRKYRRRSRAHSLDNHGQREILARPVRRTASARATTNRLRELTHALMDNNKLTRSASMVIIGNNSPSGGAGIAEQQTTNKSTASAKLPAAGESISTVTTLPRIGRSETQRVTLRNLRQQRSFDKAEVTCDDIDREKSIKKASVAIQKNRFSLDVDAATSSFQFGLPTPSGLSPGQSRRYSKKRLRGPYGEMLENRMEEMRKGAGEKVTSPRFDLTFLQELLDETRQQRQQLDQAAVETCGQRPPSGALESASSQSLDEDANTNSAATTPGQQNNNSNIQQVTEAVKDLVVKECPAQQVAEVEPATPKKCLSPSITADIKRHLDTRTHVVGELYDTEKSYVESLRILVERYMIPLKSQLIQVLDDPHAVDTIFFRVPEILRHHETFLELLRHRITSWNPQQTVGDLISDLFTSEHNIADTYTAFISNWSLAKETIRNTEQTKPAFAKFLENTSREHSKKLTLDALLIMPVQRIPRYELLVRELLKHTQESHPDKQLLMDAQKHVHELALKINQMESETANNLSEQQRVKDIEVAIDGVGQLSSPDRTFIRFDVVSDAMSKKQRAIFLFSDLLVVASIKRKSGATARKISSSPLILEAHKYKCFLKVSLDAVQINSTNNDDSRDFIDQLQTDLNTLNHISEFSSQLSCPHQVLDDAIRDLQNNLQRILAERTHADSHLELIISNQENTIMTLLFSSVERRTCWENAFVAAKQALTSDRRPPPKFISPPIAIRKTRAGLQFTCAAAVDGNEVWVCNSDGFVGQVCMLSLQADGATVTSCNGVCNARINCLTCVPAVESSQSGRDSESSESEEESTSMATMWLGTEDGIIHIYHSGDNIRIKKNRIKIQLNASVNAILYHNDKVFAALSNAQIAVFTRADGTGQWNIEPQMMPTGTTVSKMIIVGDKLWSATENRIKVSDFDFNVENQIELDTSVLCMVSSPVSVFVACQNSHSIRSYSPATGELQSSIDIASPVSRVLSHQDAIIRQHKSACLRVTSLLHVKDILFVGTSGGVIVTVRDSCPQGLVHGHTGHVRFLTSVDTQAPTTTSNNNSTQTTASNQNDGNQVLVISGGDGFEDFSVVNHNNQEGRDDSTNHLLIWQVL